MRLCRFTAGRKAYCIDPIGIRGVIDAPALARVPGAPNWIIGAYNHLGRAVAVVDVGTMAGVAPPLRSPACLVLVQSGAHLLALPIDGPPTDHQARPFARRGGLLELVDRADELLWIDVGGLSKKIEEALVGR